MNIEEIPADDFEALASVHPDGGPPKLSARLYEFFFTNFAQHNQCLHAGIDIGEQYRQKCKHFTFFRRKPDVIFGIRPAGVDCTPLKVTKGQLALFRWIHDNDVHHYIVLHEDKIKGAMQDFKKIPRSQITDESETLENLTSRFATMTVGAVHTEEENTVRLGVPRNRRFHNREMVIQKQAAPTPTPLHVLSSPTVDLQRRDQERRAEQLELRRLADLKRLERQQQELREKQQKALQKQIEKEAAKEAKKKLQSETKVVRRSTRNIKDGQTASQVHAPAEWLYPATTTDSQFRRRLGW